MRTASLKKYSSILFLFAIPFIFSFSLQESSIEVEESCRTYVLNSISQIIENLHESKKIINSSLSSNEKQDQLINLYREARKSFKETEFFIEYYSSFDAKYFINGPLVKKYDIEISSEVFEPQGFQVIEEILFTDGKKDLDRLNDQYAKLLSKFESLKEYYSTITLEKSKIAEALKLQMIRMMCLTLNGYDCTINKESIIETTYAIKGLNTVLNSFQKNTVNDAAILASFNKLDLSLKKCIDQLNKNPDSDKFDRLTFITQCLDPAYKNLITYFDQAKIGISEINYAVNFRSRSFFNNNSIRKQYFSIYQDDTLNIAKQVALGKLLFYDPVLSGNNKRACASCHQANKAFTDGLDKSLAFDHQSKVTRNSPTLLNASYQKLFFHDGRMFNLEEQANAVFHNANEMNSSADEIVTKLKQSDEYKQLFHVAFKNTQDSAITYYAVIKSIAEFVKTLDSRNSKFDKYLKGSKQLLSLSEINGYNLFSGKALCGSCHFFPLFNGTVPPMYNDNEFEVVGTPEKNDNKTLDQDNGREHISHSKIHKRAFKTPSLRNIALTAPYMHNGVYVNLDQVLEFYNKGGGAGLGLDVENQTLPFDSLSLSKKELKDLKNFLLTLTDTSTIPKPPKALPKFNNVQLNKRKIGGEY